MAASADRYVAAIIAMLQEDEALGLLPKVAVALSAKAAELAEGTVITSAISLSDEQQATIKEALDAPEARFVVDAGVLGGMVVEQHGRRLDLSLKGRIAR